MFGKKTVAVAGCGAVLAAGMVASAWVLSRFMVRIERQSTISAKGYAEKTVISDLGSFDCTISVQDSDLANGYKTVADHTSRAVAELRKLGLDAGEIEVGGVSFYPVNRWVNGRETNEFMYYALSQNVRVCSKNVEIISAGFKNLNEMLATGMKISVRDPEYFISDPEQYKLELTEAASHSARHRAEVMAENGGAKLDRLLSARLGVIQINRPASSAMSDYGVYDTSSLEKVIKIVVALEFSVK